MNIETDSDGRNSDTLFSYEDSSDASKGMPAIKKTKVKKSYGNLMKRSSLHRSFSEGSTSSNVNRKHIPQASLRSKPLNK